MQAQCTSLQRQYSSLISWCIF